MIIGRIIVYKDESFEEIEEQWSFETLDEIINDKDVQHLIKNGVPFEFYAEEVEDDYFDDEE